MRESIIILKKTVGIAVILHVPVIMFIMVKWFLGEKIEDVTQLFVETWKFGCILLVIVFMMFLVSILFKKE